MPNETESKPWYLSRTIWATIGTALAFLLGNFFKVPPEQATELSDKLVNTVPEVIGSILAVLTIVFRMKANKTIG